MYNVDERDQVSELRELPPSSVGSPRPVLMADEYHGVVVAYYVQEQEVWQTPPPKEPGDSDETIAIVRFRGCLVHMFGPPNDETFSGHPLFERGIRPYRMFRVENSSWIRKLERMNSVHSQHRPEHFFKKQHLIFAFHDSTFECICDSFDLTKMRGAIAKAIPEMVRLLGWDRQ